MRHRSILPIFELVRRSSLLLLQLVVALAVASAGTAAIGTPLSAPVPACKEACVGARTTASPTAPTRDDDDGVPDRRERKTAARPRR